MFMGTAGGLSSEYGNKIREVGSTEFVYVVKRRARLQVFFLIENGVVSLIENGMDSRCAPVI